MSRINGGGNRYHLTSTLSVLFLSVLLVAMLPIGSGEVSQTTTTLNLTCHSASTCTLDNSGVGLETMSRQESGASPLSPVTVRLEFIMSPDQSSLALLPETIDQLVIDLAIDEDSSGTTLPDIDVEFWAGPSSNSWTLEGGSPFSPKLGAYVLTDAELDLSRGRLVRPGDGVGMTVTFEIDQPVTWRLSLAGDSYITIPVEWSVDIAATNIDEPSSAGSPVELADVETLSRGALLDADQDCFRFSLPAEIRGMTIIVHWTTVPLEIEQPHTPPELIREGGMTPKNPSVKTTYEAGKTISEVHYSDPPEGSYLACWSGQNNHFQAYSWFARLTHQGMGSSSPTEFSGDATWLSGQAYVGDANGAVGVSGSHLFTLVIGVLGTAAVFFGMALPSNFVWSKKALLPLALVILIIGGIASPVVGLSGEAARAGELTLDEVIEQRLAVVETADEYVEGVPAVGAFFGLESGEKLLMRLHVTGAHPTGDGRWQVHTEELSDIRLDNYIFGYLRDNPMGAGEEVRFILQAGRTLTLDLLMLEALLVVDERPEGELLHIDWTMKNSGAAGSATEPIWSTRPDVVSSAEWATLQEELYPELLTISYCDCGTDGMEVTWRSSKRYDSDSLASDTQLSIADGLVANEHLWMAAAFTILILTGANEYRRFKSAGKLASRYLSSKS